MNRKRRVAEESGPNVPAYIVTFSDMVTLLLTFFVMLLSLANMQDPELFDTSRNAFIEYIQSYGLGIFKGKKITPEFDNTKIKYCISNPDENASLRTIDAKEEDIRRIFKKISQSMKTTPSELVAKKADFSVTNISFSPGDALLNESAKKFLTQFAVNLQQDAGSQTIKLYVLGLASDEPSGKKQWMLSAMRAQAVADFLDGVLPSQFQCPVYSWGAGAGGCWVTPDSPISKHSQILIAVLRAND